MRINRPSEGAPPQRSLISSYNRKEFILAALCALGGFIAYCVAYLFFQTAFHFVTDAFGFRHLRSFSTAFAAGIVAVVTISGLLTWRSRGRFYGYHESALFHQFEEGSAGSFEMHLQAHRITGPAYLLSQLFLAGPLLSLRAVAHLRNRIPCESGLEDKLGEALQKLRRANKWQSWNEYPEYKREILLLAKMGRIDFSAAKGVPRIKAFSAIGGGGESTLNT